MRHAVLLLLLWSTSAFGWTDAELRLLESLSLAKLKPLAPANFPTNRQAFSAAAAALGKALFFDPRLSRDGKTSCAGCHRPELAFASDRIVHTEGRGYRNTPTLLGVGWGRFFFWDGRKDSLWAQAIAPLTSAEEHDLSLKELRDAVVTNHGRAYAAAFGKPATDLKRFAANVGKALAAFEATLVPPRNALDDYVEGLRGSGARPAGFSACAEQGLRFFVGRGRCVQCHNGPRLTNEYFHNTGVPLKDSRDRADGQFVFARELADDPFRCHGRFGDGKKTPGRCLHVETLPIEPRLAGAFKTPTLRGVRLTAPYMHNGAYQTLDEVVDHYDRAELGNLGSPEIFPLAMTAAEKAELRCFLEVL